MDERVVPQTLQPEDLINSIYGREIPVLHLLDSMYLATSLAGFTEV